MKIMIIALLSFLSLTLKAQENCTVSVTKNDNKVYWNSADATGKYLFIRNLDTKLIYPQMILSKNSGSLSIKLLDENIKGYQLIFAKVTENSLILINNHVAECFRKKDCSMIPAKIKLQKDKSCQLIKSPVIK